LPAAYARQAFVNVSVLPLQATSSCVENKQEFVEVALINCGFKPAGM